MINDETMQSIIENSELKYWNMIEVIIEKKSPPKNPSQVFLGEILSNNGVFPNFFPTK